MDNLRFGTTAIRRARRRRRLRRLTLVVWALSTLGVLASTPVGGATAINFLEIIDLGDGDSPDAKASSSPTSLSSSETPEVDLGRHVLKKLRGDLGSGREAEPRTVVEIIHAAAKDFGIDGDYLVSIAECESGLNPRAYNSAGYHGLFQYDDSTWGAYGHGSIWDPEAQARATAKLLADGQSSRWPNCA